MEMIRVQSSAIRAIGYDFERQRLKIIFQQGDAYYFCRVPEHIYQGLMAARSKGSFYNDHIRDHFQC